MTYSSEGISMLDYRNKGSHDQDIPNLYVPILEPILQGLAKLEYRSIFWHKEYLEPPGGFFQPAWVVNYPGGDVGGSQYKGHALWLRLSLGLNTV